MNLETVLMCAKMAAAKQQTGLGYVDPEIQALIDELTPAPVEEVAEAVEEPPEVAQAEAEAEAMEAAEEAQAEATPAAE